MVVGFLIRWTNFSCDSISAVSIQFLRLEFVLNLLYINTSIMLILFHVCGWCEDHTDHQYEQNNMTIILYMNDMSCVCCVIGLFCPPLPRTYPKIYGFLRPWLCLLYSRAPKQRGQRGLSPSSLKYIWVSVTAWYNSYVEYWSKTRNREQYGKTIWTENTIKINFLLKTDKYENWNDDKKVVLFHYSRFNIFRIIKFCLFSVNVTLLFGFNFFQNINTIFTTPWLSVTHPQIP